MAKSVNEQQRGQEKLARDKELRGWQHAHTPILPVPPIDPHADVTSLYPTLIRKQE